MLTQTPYGIDVKEFGALGTFDSATQTGPDDTAAFQAAIDATSSGQYAGAGLWISPGRYKITQTLTLPSNCQIKTGNDGGTGGINFHGEAAATILYFAGPDGAHLFHANTQQKIIIEGVRAHDIRTGPTLPSSAVLFENVLNRAVVKKCAFYYFPGDCIKITKNATGWPSDCVELDDLWIIPPPLSVGVDTYGISLGFIDNYALVRGIKCDTPSGSGQKAVIRVGDTGFTSAVVNIEGVKHEVRNSSSALLLQGLYGMLSATGIVQRLGPGGPVVKIEGNVGSMVTLRGITGQAAAMAVVNGKQAIMQIGSNYILANRLPFWVGGADGVWVNNVQFYGQYDSWAQMNLGNPLAPSGATAVQIGDLPPNGQLGFYGKKGIRRPALTYSRASETPEQAQIRTVLANLGLVTDSTTA